MLFSKLYYPNRLQENSLDAVNKFKYLDNIIDNERCINTKIQDRIQTGNRAYYANTRLLRSKLIVYCRNSKIKMYKTLIRRWLLMGARHEH